MGCAVSALSAAARRLALRRRRGRRLLVRISPRRLRLAALIAVLAALASAGGWYLLRDSSVVSVDHVTVTGASGSDASAIREALDSAARRMTTLDFQTARLRAAVSQFPEIKGLQVTTHFPHGIVIHVIELLPVGVVKMAGREIAVTGDGTLLPNAPLTGSLPVIPIAEPPSGGRLSPGWARGAASVLAAAPRRVLPRLLDAMTIAGHGLVVQIRNGPGIYFGEATDLSAKWLAALAVLADPGSQGASYVDVTDPERATAGVTTAAPAVGGSASTGGTSITSAGSVATQSGAAGATPGAAGATPAAAGATPTATGATPAAAGAQANSAGTNTGTAPASGGG